VRWAHAAQQPLSITLKQPQAPPKGAAAPTRTPLPTTTLCTALQVLTGIKATAAIESEPMPLLRPITTLGSTEGELTSVQRLVSRRLSLPVGVGWLIP